MVVARHQKSSAPRRRKKRWETLPDDQLLKVRLCDLKLKIEKTPLAGAMKQLCREMADSGVRLQPHAWLSSEWFSPDGIPGIAIPFYLAHERLRKLEKRHMLMVEGSNRAQLMKLLRHEAGHTVCSAYRLTRKACWRNVFGKSTEPYPQAYRPKPYSRSFVLHLDWWYAQAHPLEDFAETFAVWLTPGSRWKQQYRGWTALRKLEYVDDLMQSLAGKRPPVVNRQKIEPLNQLKMTLSDFYRRKKLQYGDDWPDFYDRELRRIFSGEPRLKNRPTASGFLRKLRPTLRVEVAEWTGVPPYTVDQVLRDLIDRCRELHLRLAMPERQAAVQVRMMLTVQTMNYLHGGNFPIYL